MPIEVCFSRPISNRIYWLTSVLKTIVEISIISYRFHNTKGTFLNSLKIFISLNLFISFWAQEVEKLGFFLFVKQNNFVHHKVIKTKTLRTIKNLLKISFSPSLLTKKPIMVYIMLPALINNWFARNTTIFSSVNFFVKNFAKNTTLLKQFFCISLPLKSWWPLFFSKLLPPRSSDIKWTQKQLGSKQAF